MLGQVFNPPPRGDVLPAMVLAGKTYTAAGGFGLKVGTMKPHAQATQAMSVSTNGVNIYFRIENGAYLERIDATIQSEITAPIADVAALSPGLIPANIMQGKNIFGVIGTATADATATSDKLLINETAYVKGAKVTGAMPSNASVESSGIAGASTSKKVRVKPTQAGYYDTESVLVVDDVDFSAANIMMGKTILGIAGTGTKGKQLLPEQVLQGNNGYSNGQNVFGTMVNRAGMRLAGTITKHVVSPGVIDAKANFDGYFTKDTVISATDPNYIPANIVAGKSIFGLVGTAVTGGGTDTSDAAVLPGQMLEGASGYAKGVKVEGTMLDQRGMSVTFGGWGRSGSTILPAQPNATGLFDETTDFKITDPNFIAANIKSGVSIFGQTGTLVAGTDTSSADATAAQILSGKTAYVKGVKVTGTAADSLVRLDSIEKSFPNGGIKNISSNIAGSMKMIHNYTMYNPNNGTIIASFTKDESADRYTGFRWILAPGFTVGAGAKFPDDFTITNNSGVDVGYKYTTLGTRFQ